MVDPAAQVAGCITEVEVAGDDLEGGKDGRSAINAESLQMMTPSLPAHFVGGGN